jgi:4-carboxymuconolactone decarboxylase
MARLPEIRARELLPEAHRDVFDYLVKTRGAVSNGFSVLLNSPDVAGRIAHVGSYIRFENTLPDRVRELAALTASCEMGNSYEQTIHTHDVANLGVGQTVIDAVNGKGPLDGLSEEEALPVRAARELIRDHRLSDDSFRTARRMLGDQGCLDLVATIGYYSMLAILHVGMEIKPPAQP